MSNGKARKLFEAVAIEGRSTVGGLRRILDWSKCQPIITAALARERAEGKAEGLKEARRFEGICQYLWKLLDDIDTLDDACKDNDASFRNLTRKYQKLRWKTKAECDGYVVDFDSAEAPAEKEVRS